MELPLKKDETDNVINTEKIISPTSTDSSSTEEADAALNESLGSMNVTAASGDDRSDAQGTNIASYNRHTGIRGGDRGNGISLPDIRSTFTDKDSDFYDLSCGRRLAVVFNHETFASERQVASRKGTEKDFAAIKETFEPMGFDVVECADFTVERIRNKIMEIQNMENLACLALFILTHGEENGILYAYDTNYRLDKHVVVELLPDNCPSLAGKPKLIFIQACQGEDIDPGVHLRPLSQRQRHTSTDGAGGVSAMATYRIPSYADFLIYQASYHGHYAFRSGSGSWFIQSLCQQIKNSGNDEDLISVLTRVSRHVALERVSNIPDHEQLHDKKQIPLRQDTLLRLVYLKLQNLSVVNGNRERQHAKSVNNTPILNRRIMKNNTTTKQDDPKKVKKDKDCKMM